MSEYKIINSNDDTETITIEMPRQTAKALFSQYASSIAMDISDLNKNGKKKTKYGVPLETLEKVKVNTWNFYKTL